jgi:hypothetical protein
MDIIIMFFLVIGLIFMSSMLGIALKDALRDNESSNLDGD